MPPRASAVLDDVVGQLAQAQAEHAAVLVPLGAGLRRLRSEAARCSGFGAALGTVVLPKGRDHQIFDVGPQPMEIVGLFGATPVLTRLPDGSALELPWRS